MRILILLLILFPTVGRADFRVHEHSQVMNQIAIFHDISSAQHWAKEMNGKVLTGRDSTFIVLYKETIWVSTPNDWKE